MITWDNYEEYMMMHADGELKPHEEQALKEFLDDHPMLKYEMAYYERARMIPDESVVYDKKNSLLREEKKKVIIFFTNWRTYAVAASLIAIVCFSVVFFRSWDSADSGSVADKKDSVQQTVPTPENNSKQNENIAGTTPANETVTPVNDTPVATPNNEVNIEEAPAPKAPVQNNYVNIKKNRKEQQSAEKSVATPGEPMVMNPMKTISFEKLPVTVSVAQVAKPVAVPDYTEVPVHTEEEEQTADGQEGSWVDKLPLNDTKKKEIASVANAISQGYDKLTSIKDNITGKKISVKIQKKKLIFSF